MDNKAIRYYHQNTKNLDIGKQDICKSPMNGPVSNWLTARREEKKKKGGGLLQGNFLVVTMSTKLLNLTELECGKT